MDYDKLAQEAAMLNFTLWPRTDRVKTWKSSTGYVFASRSVDTAPRYHPKDERKDRTK